MSTTDAGPPTVVGGRYTVGDLIGRGGAADVYRARDELLGRDVAIKMFGAGGEVVAAANAEAAGERVGPTVGAPAPAPDDSVPGDPADAARYGRGEPGSRPSGPPAELVGDLEEGSDARNRREVLTLAALSHPGLVTVYDVGDDHGRAYFVMQLIEGDTLAQRIRRGPLPLGDVVALGAALADSLGYVHRRGVVHRDVKPGNVLLDADGRAHLSDFGIAAVRDAAPVTAAGMVIGTASYLSPEQVRGESVSPAVDVYALGLVLIECLTGRREYPGNALEAAVARLHRRPVVPSQLPDSLRTLLVAMTADEPGARPDADEVLAAMRSVSRDIGLDAETVLSPALMAAPTGALASTGGPPVHALATGVVPSPADVPTGAAPAPGRSPRRGLLVAVGIALAAVLVAGSALAYTLVSGARAEPLPQPVPTSVPAPPAPVAVAPTTTRSAETVESTRARATTTRPRARVRTTTTTVAPVVPPVAPVRPVVPAPVPPVATVPPTTPRSAPPTSSSTETPSALVAAGR